MIIRKVKTEDILQLIELLVDFVKEIPPVALELEPLVMKGERWITPFLKTNSGRLVVADNNGKIVGFCYAIIPKYYKPIAYIGIAVSKEYRKKDIGSQMFYNIAEWTSKKHLQYIIADIWEWNTKSIKFFEKVGFIEKERFNDKFRGDEKCKVRYIMKL
jgi:RimJ/RimL family protein N-acetyltransferase